MDTSVFKKGIIVTTIKNKWRNLLLIIQNFITYEGICGNMFFYHVCFMMHFLEGNEINFPYFLLQSLKKMANSTQKKIRFIENTIYHHGLIQMLIEGNLKTKGDN